MLRALMMVFLIFMLLYADDMLVAATNKQDVIEMKALFVKEFNMKDLGTSKKILAIEIYRDKRSRKLWLSQRNYIEKVLDRFDMSKAKLVSTVLTSHFRLFQNQCPKLKSEIESMSSIPYVSVVDYLMYSIVYIRLDLAHDVS